MILMWAVDSCVKQPEYSIVPQIQIPTISFKREAPTFPDTLIFTFKFTDGDGDLGVNGDEKRIYNGKDSIDIESPYYYVYDTTINKVWYYTHTNSVTLRPKFKYVNFRSKRKIATAPFDTLPSLSCKNWELRSSPIDTLYLELNPKTNNIFIDAYIKNTGSNTYTYFDPTTYFGSTNLKLCVTNFFYGRFPVLAKDVNKKNPLDGILTYKIPSAALYLIFHNKTVKFKIYITDRAFHKSNVIETSDYNFN